MVGSRKQRRAQLPTPAAAVLLALLITLFGSRGAAAQDIGLPVGTQAQPVALEDLDGNPVDLAQVIGRRPVLLEFWAIWCPLCEELEPAMQSVVQRYGDALDVVVVAVGVNQNPRSIRRHLARHPVPGRVLFDARGAATRAFRAPATSYVVVLDAGGRVAYTGQGGDQDLMAAVRQVIGR